jgi:hypothetical protein
MPPAILRSRTPPTPTCSSAALSCAQEHARRVHGVPRGEDSGTHAAAAEQEVGGAHVDAAGVGAPAARRLPAGLLQGAAPFSPPHHRNRDPVSFLLQSPERLPSVANALVLYAWPLQPQQLLRLHLLLSAARLLCWPKPKVTRPQVPPAP